MRRWRRSVHTSRTLVYSCDSRMAASRIIEVEAAASTVPSRYLVHQNLQVADFRAFERPNPNRSSTCLWYRKD
jgi:hypothetical protein